jgi:hypothetical protein
MAGRIELQRGDKVVARFDQLEEALQAAQNDDTAALSPGIYL